jgi:branched-subunit amino acid transport protein
MTSTDMWLVILGGMAVTFLTRYSFIGIMPADRLSPQLRSALRFVAPAVLAAIVAPALFMPKGALDISLTNIRLIAGLAATLVALRFRSVWLTIVCGLAALWALSALLAG